MSYAHPGAGFVYVQWAFFFLLAATLVGLSLRKGLLGRGTPVYWRSVKLMSALLGVVGLCLLLLNLDSTVRQLVDARDDRRLEFLDLKLFITQKMSDWCGTGKVDQQAKLTCFDIHQIDGIASFVYIRDNRDLPNIENWKHNPQIQDFVKELNRKIDSVNRYTPQPDDRFTLFSTFDRVRILELAAVLAIISMAGSVGESAFQLRQARDSIRTPT